MVFAAVFAVVVSSLSCCLLVPLSRHTPYEMHLLFFILLLLVLLSLHAKRVCSFGPMFCRVGNAVHTTKHWAEAAHTLGVKAQQYKKQQDKKQQVHLIRRMPA